jgi:hypothetical protein
MQMANGGTYFYTAASVAGGAVQSLVNRLFLNSDGTSVFYGTAPSAPAANTVAIGGGRINQGGGFKLGKWAVAGAYSFIQHSDLTETAGNYGFIQNSSGSTLINCATGGIVGMRCNNSPVLEYTDGDAVKIYGTPPGAPATNTVAIGGGAIRAYGRIYTGASANGWDLRGYTAGSPGAATGYVTVDINGTSYKLLCI